MIVTSDEILRRYVPNALCTVEGEVSLYDKLTPHLNAAQIWLGTYVITEDQLAELDEAAITMQAAEYICHRAFHDAIPDLDLILTPNGFGIVSNQTIAPASKERIERLQRSTALKANGALMQLNRLLRRNGQWTTDMPQGKTYGRTICDWSLIIHLNLEADIEALPKMLPELLNTEDYIKQHVLSPELYDAFIHSWQLGTLDIQGKSLCIDFCHVATRILQSIFLNGGEKHHPDFPIIANFVNRIRHSDYADQWQQTETAQFWQPEVYRNTKQSAGYWF